MIIIKASCKESRGAQIIEWDQAPHWRKRRENEVKQYKNKSPNEASRFFFSAPSDISLERLRFTFTTNGKREFVPRDQVFPLIVVYCLSFQLKKISSFTPLLYITIVLNSFYFLF